MSVQVLGNIAHVLFFNEFNHYKYGALCDGWIEFLEFFESKRCSMGNDGWAMTGKRRSFIKCPKDGVTCCKMMQSKQILVDHFSSSYLIIFVPTAKRLHRKPYQLSSCRLFRWWCASHLIIYGLIGWFYIIQCWSHQGRSSLIQSYSLPLALGYTLF